MVRRRVEIKSIEEKSKRHTTFTKRRKGLEKKIEEFVKKSDAHVALLTISKAANTFCYGHPSVEMVVNRYIADPNSALRREAAAHGDKERAQPDLEKRIAVALETRRWDVAVQNLGLRELDECIAEVERIIRRLAERRREIEAKRKTAADLDEIA